MSVIVLSQIVARDTQSDGRIAMTERHLDDQGLEYFCVYMAETVTNPAAHLTATASNLNASLAAAQAPALPMAQARVTDLQQALSLAQSTVTTLQAAQAAPTSA